MERLDLDLIAQQAGNGVLDVFSYSTYVLDLVNFFLQFLKCNVKQDTELGSKKEILKFYCSAMMGWHLIILHVFLNRKSCQIYKLIRLRVLSNKGRVRPYCGKQA